MTSVIKKMYKTIDYTKYSFSIAGGERSYAAFEYPNDMNVALGATLIITPNADWVIAKIVMQSDELRVYMHNEYTSALSGIVKVRLLYI